VHKISAQISNKTSLQFTKRPFPPTQHPPKIRSWPSGWEALHLSLNSSQCWNRLSQL